MNKNEIEQKASDLLKEHDFFEAPVRVLELAGELSIDVTYEDLDDEISGVLVIADNGKVGMGLNDFHHPNRQRFTIAHELGHFVLHSTQKNLFIDASPTYFRDQKSTKGNDDVEIQANAFAAALLMPKELIHQAISDNNIDYLDEYDISKLAEIFRVSEQALTIRLVRLGLIKPL